MFWTGAAALSLLIWIYLVFARGSFWRIVTTPSGANAPARKVIAIIPARNEADVIGEAVASLLTEDLLAPLHVILVDDASTDGTAETARQAAQKIGRAQHLTVLTGAPLPPGWTGKLWAVSQGAQAASEQQPDYLLFTDADIRHHSRSVAELVAKAEAEQLDLASYMVRLATANIAEKALIPAFVYFFLQLYPPNWIASAKHQTAAAAGGCLLIKPAALARIGGHAAIRSQIIDDCSLARVVKSSGGKIWMGLTAQTQSLRPYNGFAEIGRMISRSAFNQLRHSALLLTGTLLALATTYVIPLAALGSGQPLAASFGALAWLLMSISYAPMIRFYRLRLIWAFCLPLIAIFYAGATLHSAIQYWRGKGGAWKGRIQDA
jgi:hopene-associated glycosyltransferase HpnB